MNARPYVLDFFLPLDPQNVVMSALEGMLEMASAEETSQAVAEAVSAVHARLRDQKRPLVTQEQMIVYERLHKSNDYSHGNEGPDFVKSLLAVLYLRAKIALQTENAPFFRNSKENLQKVKPALDALPPDFFGELLVEAEIRANRSPVFGKTLSAVSKEIATLGSQLGHLKESGQAFLQKDNSGGVGDCECVAHACNNVGKCQDFCIESWWDCLLLFLAIVVIIIIGVVTA